MDNPGRSVTVVLVDPTGALLGSLPPFDTGAPWWADATEIVDAVRAKHGVEITVLRLLTAESGRHHGGSVSYLASTRIPVPDAARTGDEPRLDDHPLRLPWARPGGPEKILAWAGERMAAIGRQVLGAAQQRTWNLSALWRLDTPAGPAWLKVVPPFFDHEPALLEWLHRAVPGRTPVPLVAERGRMIMDAISGDDRYDAKTPERLVMMSNLLQIQEKAVSSLAELRALRVPSLGFAELKAAATDLVARRGGEASRRAVGDPPADAQAALDALIDGLDDRFAEIAACGVPMTLVHGDFHPGNVRGAGSDLVILDWGDAVISHPGFDVLHICESLDPADADLILGSWCREWRRIVPGCDPARALELLRPVDQLRLAIQYLVFLENIEPSERVYHELDVLPGLLAAARSGLG